MELRYCPMCDASAQPLGVLGHLAHYRCGACGLQFSVKLRKKAMRKKLRSRKNSTVDLTPTWVGLYPALIGVLRTRGASAKAKRDVKAEIRRAARFLDKHEGGTRWTDAASLSLPLVDKSEVAAANIRRLLAKVDWLNRYGASRKLKRS